MNEKTDTTINRRFVPTAAIMKMGNRTLALNTAIELSKERFHAESYIFHFDGKKVVAEMFCNGEKESTEEVSLEPRPESTPAVVWVLGFANVVVYFEDGQLVCSLTDSDDDMFNPVAIEHGDMDTSFIVVPAMQTTEGEDAVSLLKMGDIELAQIAAHESSLPENHGITDIIRIGTGRFTREFYLNGKLVDSSDLPGSSVEEGILVVLPVGKAEHEKMFEKTALH